MRLKLDCFINFTCFALVSAALAAFCLVLYGFQLLPAGLAAFCIALSGFVKLSPWGCAPTHAKP